MKTIAVLSLVVMLSGCGLTSAQNAEIEALRIDAANAAATIAELMPVKERIDKALSDLVTALKNRQIPLEEFNALSAIYREQNEIVMGKIKELQSSYADAAQRIEKLKESGVNGWAIVGSLIANIVLGAVGIKLKGVAGVEAAQKNAVIAGIEEMGPGLGQTLRNTLIETISAEAERAGVGKELHMSVKAVTPMISDKGM